MKKPMRRADTVIRGLRPNFLIKTVPGQTAPLQIGQGRTLEGGDNKWKTEAGKVGQWGAVEDSERQLKTVE